MVSRALTLLVDNAVKHGGKHVRVRVTPEGSLVRVCEEDDGPGLPKLLEAFSRGRGRTMAISFCDHDEPMNCARWPSPHVQLRSRRDGHRAQPRLRDRAMAIDLLSHNAIIQLSR